MMTRDDWHKWVKRCIAFLSDVVVTILSWLTTSWLIHDTLLSLLTIDALVFIISFQSACYILCGLYRGVWRYASIPDLMRILKAVGLSITVTAFILQWSHPLSLEFLIILSLLLFVMLSGTRLVYRFVKDYRKEDTDAKRVLIVGAGNAGESIIRELFRGTVAYSYHPVGIVDDDVTRLGCDIHGVRVLGTCVAIPQLIEEHEIELILIAIPSASAKRMRDIVRYCEESKIPFRTLPGIHDIAGGAVTVNALREVQLDDLLGREEVFLDWERIRDVIANKKICVTGGGGSIGSELCQQIANLSPEQLIIIDHHEFNLYAVDMALKNKIPPEKLKSYLCNVTDKQALDDIFARHKPDLVFHVAAYKHVPLLENHIRSAVFNNLIGTKTVAECADRHHVNAFVLISTDKAVNPSNVMGATKRASEIFCQTFNNQTNTRFITVRFGNVLDSAGSVIPLFRTQLQKGGPLTVTHPDITRYFMTIPEASQLILQAVTMDDQGDIFVLDMGDPIKISYLAEQMIKLSGKIVGQEIEIVYTGLRPGEKLYEELFHANEDIRATWHPKIKQAKVRQYAWTPLLDMIISIERACHDRDETRLKDLLLQLVPEYQAEVCPPEHVV